MRYNLSSLLLGLAALTLVACTRPQQEAAPLADNWPMLDEFHALMADSYHPFADSANLEPAKMNAAAMAELSQKWLAAPVPEGLDTSQVRPLLRALEAEVVAFQQNVPTAEADSLALMLSQAHEIFHQLQHIWHRSTQDRSAGEQEEVH